MAEGAGETVRVIHSAGDPLSGELRVRRGAEIAITLHGSPAYGWTAITGGEGPLVLLRQSEREGDVEAVLRADRTGAVELRSMSSFRGDRFGPQTRLWRLVVHVAE